MILNISSWKHSLQSFLGQFYIDCIFILYESTSKLIWNTWIKMRQLMSFRIISITNMLTLLLCRSPGYGWGHWLEIVLCTGCGGRDWPRSWTRQIPTHPWVTMVIYSSSSHLTSPCRSGANTPMTWAENTNSFLTMLELNDHRTTWSCSFCLKNKIKTLILFLNV